MNIKAKLTSRKFWAAVAAFVTGVMQAMGQSNETAVQVAGLIMAGAAVVAYIVGEGLVDAADAQAAVYVTEGDEPSDVSE